MWLQVIKMDKEQLIAFREWVRAEVEYGVFDNIEDEEGYRGSAYTEKEEANRLFNVLCELIEGE